jgi:short-subunit dehydrogenase
MKNICIVSGGSGGLGLEMALLLKKAGKNVLIIGRDNEKLSQALTMLNGIENEANVASFRCNVGNEHDVAELCKYLQGENFVVEYLFNNAGRGLFLEATESTSELIDKVFEPNLKGLILLTSHILKITSGETELTIVNIMSTSALLGRAEETIYCAAKWGARGYTEALRTELKGTKRNIIAVYPGGMKTGFWDVTGHHKDISGFMDPSEVAQKIINAVMIKDRLAVTDITINRK